MHPYKSYTLVGNEDVCKYSTFYSCCIILNGNSWKKGLICMIKGLVSEETKFIFYELITIETV